MKRLLPALLLLAPLAACGGADEAADDRPVVAASFYPLAWVAEQVAGDAARVEDLTPAGTEPHDLELTVSQRADIAGADAVFYIGGFQPAVDEAAQESPEEARVDATSYVGLAPAPEGEHEEGEEDHAHEEGDPHLWLDPTQLAKVTAGFADRMGDLDPANRATYAANADRTRRELAQLDRELQAGLAQCRTRTLVTSHDAFGYLGRRYDLDLVPIAGLSPDAEPSAKQLAAIRKEAQDAGVTTVFSERLASPALAQTLARELDVDTAVLDTVESAPESGDYLAAMRANLAALQQANGCS